MRTNVENRVRKLETATGAGYDPVVMFIRLVDHNLKAEPKFAKCFGRTWRRNDDEDVDDFQRRITSELPPLAAGYTGYGVFLSETLETSH